MTTSDTSSTSTHTTVPAAAAYLEAQTATGRWTLDPSATEVHFHTTSMWGLAKVHGQFTTVTGDGTVDADGNATGTLTIDASSLTTKIKTRDKHLRSAAFFDVGRYPTLSFSVREITPLTGSDIEIAGDLSIRGRLQPLTIRATLAEATATTLSIKAELTIDRSRFGITWNPVGMATMKTRVEIHAGFHRTR